MYNSNVPVFYSISVFKIYNIEEEKFEEKLNLRVGKNLNLNFSSTDVAWNHIEGKDSIQMFEKEGKSLLIVKAYRYKLLN